MRQFLFPDCARPRRRIKFRVVFSNPGMGGEIVGRQVRLVARSRALPHRQDVRRQQVDGRTHRAFSHDQVR